MSRVIVTIGIPASGKTVWARRYVHDNPKTLITCRDDIRAEKNLPYGDLKVEEHITNVQRVEMKAAIRDGLDVIVADTNMVERFRRSLITFAHSLGADVEIKLFPIELREALWRDALRDDPVGEAVVRRFYEMWMNMDPIEEGIIPVP